MAEEITLNDLTLEETIAELNRDHVLTANEELEQSVRGVVDNAGLYDIENVNVVFLDRDPSSAEELFNFAHEIIDAQGGTAIVRSPGLVGIASTDYAPAAITAGIDKMFETPGDYPLGLTRLFEQLQQYQAPWTLGGLLIGALIIATFIIFTAYWWNRGAGKSQD